MATVAEFHAALSAYHPFAGRPVGRTALDSVLTEVIKALRRRPTSDSLTLSQLIGACLPFRELIGDGHLQLRPVLDKVNQKVAATYQYDLSLRRDTAGRLYLSDTTYANDSTVLPKGAELTHLQGRAVGEFISEVTAFIGIDDHGLPDGREYLSSVALPEYYQRVYGYRDSLQLRVTMDGDTSDVWVAPRGEEQDAPGERMRRRRRRGQRLSLIALDTTRLPGVGLLEIRSFSKKVLGKGDPYRKVRRIMRELDRGGTKALIVDVRSNTGGSADLVDHVFSFLATDEFVMLDSMYAYTGRATGKNAFAKTGEYIFGGVRRRNGRYEKLGSLKLNKPRRRRHFDGEVIVLTDEITFSGGTALAHYVQHYRRGRVVGQTPGGSAERMYAGSLFEIKIGPNDELRVNMPLWYMDMVGDARGNVTPDLVVPRTRENQLSDTDPVVEAALRLLEAEGVPQG